MLRGAYRTRVLVRKEVHSRDKFAFANMYTIGPVDSSVIEAQQRTVSIQHNGIGAPCLKAMPFSNADPRISLTCPILKLGRGARGHFSSLKQYWAIQFFNKKHRRPQLVSSSWTRHAPQ